MELEERLIGDELLTVEQVLLLEELTYLANKDEIMFDLATIQQDKEDDDLTVREIISKIEIDQLDENVDYSTFEKQRRLVECSEYNS